MICKTQPDFLKGKPTPITEIIEVRLPLALWRKVYTLARHYRLTYSTVTRLCVLHVAEAQKPYPEEKLARLKQQDKEEYAAGDHHRHLVCLYGDDARLLRLAALQMGISLSVLIRLALRVHLGAIAMEFQSQAHRVKEIVFWRGIKRWIAIPLITENHLRIPAVRRFFHQSFPPEYRWGWPKTV